MVGDVPGDDGPGADKGVPADRDAADDGAVGPQGGAPPDDGGPDLVHLRDLRPGVVDVREDHGGAAEDPFLQGNPLVDGDVVLDLAAGADGDIRADDDVLADVAPLAHGGTGEDVGEVPDLRAFADGHPRVDNGGGVDEDVGGRA